VKVIVPIILRTILYEDAKACVHIYKLLTSLLNTYVLSTYKVKKYVYRNAIHHLSNKLADNHKNVYKKFV